MKYAVAIALLLAGIVLSGPARAGDGILPDCEGCPPPNKYDSQETVKTQTENRRTIDTINTYEMAPKKPAIHSGIRVRADVTLVNFVVHKYRVIYAGELVEASDVAAPHYRAPRYHAPRRCKYGRYGCGPLRVRG